MNEDRQLVVGADVGGTTTKLALALFEAGVPRVLDRQTYRSAQYGSLDEVIAAFLSRSEVVPYVPAVRAACFAVAGPVEHGRGSLTNLPWRPDETEIARRFGFPYVRVVNDFAAAGHGIAYLGADDLLTLQHGAPVEREARVVVGAGTGLGVAILDWDDAVWEVHASEAGHTDFAPIDPLQDQLLLYLRSLFGRVSYERVISGPGLPRILEFLERNGGIPRSPALTTAMREGDPARAIAEFALRKQDDVAVRALDLFVRAYGAFAGNMALASLAHGGVYIAGGIAPQIADKLLDGTFTAAFTDKGRFQTLLKATPIYVVMNNQVGLYGALSLASKAPSSVSGGVEDAGSPRTSFKRV
jgi:glucokinase